MKLFSYRYLFRTKDTDAGKVCVRLLTGTVDEIQALEEKIKADDSIVSCMKEYVCEYDLAFFGFTETIKREENKNVT